MLALLTTLSLLTLTTAYLRTHHYEPHPSIETHTFNQKLDHFDTSNSQTFAQRYYLNRQHHNSSLLFLYIGGESQLSPSSIAKGEILDFAQQHNALIAGLEHRYYGQSHPFVSLDTSNLHYLSSQQALADIAFFAQHLKTDFSLDAIYTVGGSYPGALSAWVRLKYPHLIDGALASSAPLEAKADFYEYDEVVAEQLGECSNLIRNATEIIEAQIFDHDKNAQAVKSLFGCEAISDNTEFLYTLADLVSFAVQYNTNRNDSVKWQIKRRMCEEFERERSLVESFAVYVKQLLKSQNQTCLEASTSFERLSNISTDPNNDSRQWYWQSCTEFGWFQTAWRLRSQRITLKFHLDLCERVFGALPDIDATNAFYGGRNYSGSNVVFVNGLADPWHPLSVLMNSSKALNRAYVIENETHCSDLYSKSFNDSVSLNLTRAAVMKTMNQFVNQALHSCAPGEEWMRMDDMWMCMAPMSMDETDNRMLHVVGMLILIIVLLGGCFATIVAARSYFVNKERRESVDQQRSLARPLLAGSSSDDE